MVSVCFSLLSYDLPMPLFPTQKSSLPSSLAFQENRERYLNKITQDLSLSRQCRFLIVSLVSVNYILKMILSSPWQLLFFFFFPPNTRLMLLDCLGSHVSSISHSGVAQKSLTNLGRQPSLPVTDAHLTEQRFALLQAGTWLHKDQQWQRGCRLAS